MLTRLWHNFFTRAVVFKLANCIMAGLCFAVINIFFSQNPASFWLFSFCSGGEHCHFGYNATRLEEIFPQWGTCVVPIVASLAAQKPVFQCYLAHNKINAKVFLFLNAYFFCVFCFNAFDVLYCLYRLSKAILQTDGCKSGSLKLRLGVTGLYLVSLIKEHARFCVEQLVCVHLIRMHYQKPAMYDVESGGATQERWETEPCGVD